MLLGYGENEIIKENVLPMSIDNERLRLDGRQVFTLILTNKKIVLEVKYKNDNKMIFSHDLSDIYDVSSYVERGFFTSSSDLILVFKNKKYQLRMNNPKTFEDILKQTVQESPEIDNRHNIQTSASVNLNMYGNMAPTNPNFKSYEAQNIGGNKYCPNCGNSINPNTKFCSNCGNTITTTSTPNSNLNKSNQNITEKEIGEIIEKLKSEKYHENVGISLDKDLATSLSIFLNALAKQGISYTHINIDGITLVLSPIFKFRFNFRDVIYKSSMSNSAIVDGKYGEAILEKTLKTQFILSNYITPEEYTNIFENEIDLAQSNILSKRVEFVYDTLKIENVEDAKSYLGRYLKANNYITIGSLEYEQCIYRGTFWMIKYEYSGMKFEAQYDIVNNRITDLGNSDYDLLGGENATIYEIGNFYCHACNFPIKKNIKFCERCGVELKPKDTEPKTDKKGLFDNIKLG